MKSNAARGLLARAQTEIETSLRGLPKSARSPWPLDHYIGAGQSELEFVNLKVPAVRARMKQGFSFSNQEDEHQFAVWNHVFLNSTVYEALLCGLIFVEKTKDKGLARRRDIMKWSKRIDNWALADGLSALIAHYREMVPKDVDPVLAKWSLSKNPWLVRLSLVSLYNYARLRQTAPPCHLVLRRVKEHLSHDHVYVQKGYGWTLRENFNVYPKETLAFLREHAAKIKPAAWYASTEKLSKRVKAELLGLRGGSYKSKSL
jgi:3-methyladenine DNA glycosylase AlkD